MSTIFAIPILDRARRYLAQMPVSIAGSGGDDAAFQAACVAAIGFDLDDETALEALNDWNQRCLPPWNELYLRGRIARARRDCKRAIGFLRASKDRDKAEHTPHTPASFTPDRITREEAEAFASRRGLSLDAIKSAVTLGVLRAGWHSRFGRSLAVAEKGWWQCRPIAESTFTNGRKTDSKPGTAPKFFGASWLGDCPRILLVEGVVGWLEALDCILSTGRIEYAAISAYNWASTFKEDLQLLGRLATKKILIIPDAGEPGTKGALRWGDELTAVGAQVEFALLPDGCGDLGDLLRLPSAGEHLAELFTLPSA